MSNNAVAAYDSGLIPASKLATVINRRFGVKVNAAWIDSRLRYAEAHHASKKFNLVKFYDSAETVAAIEADESLLESARDFTAATKATLAVSATYIADVIVEKWERVQINHYGKLAWRKNYVRIQTVAVTPVGVAFAEIAGYGRKALKNLTITKLDSAEVMKRKRRAAGLKAAATRASKLARLEFAAKLVAATKPAGRLLLVQKTDSTVAADRAARQAKFATCADWKVAGCQHPAPDFVLAAKRASGLGWTAFEASI